MLNESSDRKTPLTIERTWFARTETMALLEGEIALIAVLREPEGAVFERRTLACLKAPCMLPSPPPLLGGGGVALEGCAGCPLGAVGGRYSGMGFSTAGAPARSCGAAGETPGRPWDGPSAGRPSRHSLLVRIYTTPGDAC
jgi:hypothetical protein